MSVRRLPLFPLPLVLFPGVLLPLHIFEARYRQMLADCLLGDREFGIVYRPDGVPEHDLEPGRVGCVARVGETRMLPDGRSNVVVSGRERFALERFVESSAPYYVCEVSSYEDLNDGPEALAAMAERVRALFHRVGRAARALADDAEPLPELPDDPARLSFTVASLIDLKPDARQRLLASRSPLDRLRQVDELLSPAVESIELRATVHRRARSNGHGPHAQA